MDLAWRIDATCSRLGLPPPPFAVRLSVHAGMIGCSGIPGRMSMVVQWLDGIADVEPAPGLSSKTAILRFHQPPSWLQGLQHAVVNPEGPVTLFTLGPDPKVVMTRLGLPSGTAAVRSVIDDPDEGMTWRQRHAMEVAVALGYYDVPRRIDLRGLSQRLGVSHGTLSEMLRRGERMLVTAFCDKIES